MRDIPEMKRIDDYMRNSGDVIQKRQRSFGWDYYIGGRYLSPQVVRDMISDGWLIEGDSSVYRK